MSIEVEALPPSISNHPEIRQWLSDRWLDLCGRLAQDPHTRNFAVAAALAVTATACGQVTGGAPLENLPSQPVGSHPNTTLVLPADAREVPTCWNALGEGYPIREPGKTPSSLCLTAIESAGQVTSVWQLAKPLVNGHNYFITTKDLATNQVTGHSASAEEAEQLISESISLLAQGKGIPLKLSPVDDSGPDDRFDPKLQDIKQVLPTQLDILPTNGRVSPNTSKIDYLGCDTSNVLRINAAFGTPFVAAKSGEVVYKGRLKGAGNYSLIIKHTDGTYAIYAGPAGTLVKAGGLVKAGDQLGFVGASLNDQGQPYLQFALVKGTYRPGWAQPFGSDCQIQKVTWRTLPDTPAPAINLQDFETPDPKVRPGLEQAIAEVDNRVYLRFPLWYPPTVRIWEGLVNDVARYFDKDPRAATAFIIQETFGNQQSVSTSEAMGLTQFIPDTWKSFTTLVKGNRRYLSIANKLGVNLDQSNPFRPRDSIFYMFVYLDNLLPDGQIPKTKTGLDRYIGQVNRAVQIYHDGNDRGSPSPNAKIYMDHVGRIIRAIGTNDQCPLIAQELIKGQIGTGSSLVAETTAILGYAQGLGVPTPSVDEAVRQMQAILSCP